MRLVIIGHALAGYAHRVEFLEHDAFAALRANALGEVVAVVALSQRGFRRFRKFTFFCHVECSFIRVDVDGRDKKAGPLPTRKQVLWIRRQLTHTHPTLDDAHTLIEGKVTPIQSIDCIRDFAERDAVLVKDARYPLLDLSQFRLKRYYVRF